MYKRSNLYYNSYIMENMTLRQSLIREHLREINSSSYVVEKSINDLIEEEVITEGRVYMNTRVNYHDE